MDYKDKGMSIFDTPEYKERWAMYQLALDAGIPIVATELADRQRHPV